MASKSDKAAAAAREYAIKLDCDIDKAIAECWLFDKLLEKRSNLWQRINSDKRLNLKQKEALHLVSMTSYKRFERNLEQVWLLADGTFVRRGDHYNFEDAVTGSACYRGTTVAPSEWYINDYCRQKHFPNCHTTPPYVAPHGWGAMQDDIKTIG